MSLSGNAAIPAVDSRRKALAHMSGMRIVELVKENVKPSDILIKEAFENAIKVNCAIGGSTNAIIHLLAIAGRVRGGVVNLTLDDFDVLGRDVPTIVNLMPAGEFLMEEFYYAGGLPVVMKAMIDGGYIRGDGMTVTGKSHRENVESAENFDDRVIMPLDAPLVDGPHVAVLRGNMAPNGAVIKVSASSRHLLQHTGRACVFRDIDDYKARIDDDGLDVDENSVLILQNCGLRGYPGMAEVGNMALPAKLLKKGIEV